MLLFSTHWTGTLTAEQVLDGGNIQVRLGTPNNLLLEGTPAASNAGAALTHEQLAPVVADAISIWAGAGYDVQALQQVDARIQDLAANQLGAAFGQTIWIDSDAAGHGWRDGQSGSGVDLLSVVVHEMGHVLGLEHDVLGTHLAAGASDRSADFVLDDLVTHTGDVDEASLDHGPIDFGKRDERLPNVARAHARASLVARAGRQEENHERQREVDAFFAHYDGE